jgi:hypothetical protein
MWHCFAQALYLLLVTNKGSNILEDLETLRLLAKVVPEYVDSIDEEVISRTDMIRVAATLCNCQSVSCGCHVVAEWRMCERDRLSSCSSITIIRLPSHLAGHRAGSLQLAVRL